MEGMSESLGSPAPIPPAETPPLPERRADFLVACQKLRDTTSDAPLQNLLTCALEEYETNPDFPPVIDTMLAWAPYGGATMDVYKFQKNLIGLELALDPNLPCRWNEPKDCKAALHRLIYDEKYQDEFLFRTLLPNNANVPQRSAILKALMVADGRNYPLTGIEVASSVMLNLQMLLLHGRRQSQGVNYEDITVMRRLPPDEGQPEPRYVPDMTKTRKLNRVIKHAPFVIKEAVGIDILGHPRDARVQELARVNSFRLSELRDERRRELFDTLLHNQAPQIDFHFDDAAFEGFDYERLYRHHPEISESDFIFIPTVMYMLSEAQRQQMFWNFVPLLRPPSRSRPAGRLVMLDYIAGIKPGGNIEMHKYWDPYTSYGAWTYKADEPELGLQKVISVEEGRARKVVYEQALGRLAWATELLGVDPYRDPRDLNGQFYKLLAASPA